MSSSKIKSDKESPSLPSIMRQVNRMVAFIELEGDEKAESIDSKTEEEYHLIKGNDVQNGRRKLVEQYDKKFKAMEKEQNIKDQQLKTTSQMSLYQSRDTMVSDLKKEIEDRMIEDVKNEKHCKTILKNSIHQSLLVLLEKEIVIKVLEKDSKGIQNILNEIKEDFKEQTDFECNILVAKKYLPDKYIGGCVAYNRKCSIKVSNTLYDRCNVTMNRLSLTGLRAMLFGKNKNRAFDT